MSNEARLYFVVTVKGDLGPFSKQELREHIRDRTIVTTDRVRNAFGRPLGTVAEVLGSSTQMPHAAPPPAAAPPSARRPVHRGGPPWPIIGVATGVVLVLVLLWAFSGRTPVPPPTPAPTPAPAPVQPIQTAPPVSQPAPTASPTDVRPAQLAVQANGLPAGFTLIDLGDARPRGSAAANDRGVIVISGGGSDIWGERDECAFLYRPLAGNAIVTVQVRSMEDTDAWDKVGLMLRSSTDARSVQVSIVAIHSGLIQFLARQEHGYRSTAEELKLDRFPIWLRLERSGAAVTGFASADGVAWKQVGRIAVPALANPAVVGLAVCSHNRSVTNRAEFTDLNVLETDR